STASAAARAPGVSTARNELSRSSVSAMRSMNAVVTSRAEYCPAAIPAANYTAVVSVRLMSLLVQDARDTEAVVLHRRGSGQGRIVSQSRHSHVRPEHVADRDRVRHRFHVLGGDLADALDRPENHIELLGVVREFLI